MAKLTLTPVSGLGACAAPVEPRAQPAGITLAERGGLSMCSVLSRKGTQRDLTIRVREMFGIDLPDGPRHTEAAAIAFLGTGPGQWLALADGAQAAAFEHRLRAGLAGLASVTDESDSCIIVQIGGARARDLLAKGFHVDLHPRVFGAGAAATTMVAHMRVHLWRCNARPCFECATTRSFALSLWDWLLEAGAEYGIDTTVGTI